MDNSGRLYHLLQQVSEGRASKENLEELRSLLGDPSQEKMASDWLFKKLQQAPVQSGYSEERLQAVLHAIRSKRTVVRPQGTVQFMRRYGWVAAASVILLLAAASMLIFNNKPGQQIAQTRQQRFKNDIAPGNSKAILTLANGRQVVLDSTSNGTLTLQGSTKIIKLDSGRIAYKAPGEAPAEVLYNTITTPRGGQYQVVLADGTRVWLNAASSLKYPTVFSGKERNVELTGEGYFEVAHNSRMPFRVKAGNAIVEDLGTRFNINAYPDEPALKTTLLEGSVKVGKLILQPGEQADVNGNGTTTLVKDADVADVVAWKDGKFRFNRVTIQAIMRQAARWYDVEVEFKGQIPETFSGGIPRSVNISQLLAIMEYSNKVTFEIEGRKIIVQPK